MRPVLRLAFLAWLPLFAALAACDPKESSNDSGAVPSTPPDPVRFGQRQEPRISPEAKDMLDRAKSHAAATGAAVDPTADAGRWSSYFDGAATRSPLDESKVASLMSREGVSGHIVDTVMRESRQQGADPLLVFSVIKQESGFDPRAHSRAGARGLMQIMPDTGRGLGVRNPSQLYDPQTNIQAGVRYLKDMFGKFSDVTMEQLATINPFSDNGVKAAIAAYNAGPGAVSKYDGVPPFRETRNYVQKVLGYYEEFRQRVSAG
jgi:soluble lytic murein transglycosylase-like protein